MPWTSDKSRLAASHAAAVLDFGEVLQTLAAAAVLDRSRERLLDLAPLGDVEVIEARRRRVRQWQRLLDEGQAPDLTGLSEIAPAVERSRVEGAQLESELLGRIAETLLALGRFRELIQGAHSAPDLRSDLGAERDFSGLAREITRCIDEEGQVRDNASADLSRCRRQLQSLREQVRGTLDRLAGEKLEGKSERNPRLRSGRLVLPVPRGEKSLLPGIVHDESASGRTLFVEPLETVEMNNQVAGLHAAERAELRRILIGLTTSVAGRADEIIDEMERFSRLEMPLAVARVFRGDGHTWAAQGGGESIRLVAARHPLLDRYLPAGSQAVPLDLDMAADERLLLVTGPNTGGKTVLLKTVGLLVLMNQSGLPLPVGDGSQLPHFDSLMVDIGDEQSLRDSQSTFSAHLAHLAKMIGKAGRGTLLLVDEIGDGTDPEEGAALARAAMEHWLRRGARALVSTHLRVLKGFAQETDGVLNGAMSFDADANRPLYRLRIGSPGSSRALATARRLGLDDGVLARAEELIGHESMKLERLIARLEEETREASRLRREGEEHSRHSTALAAELREKINALGSERRELLAETRHEGEQLLSRMRKSIEAQIRELREQAADRASILKAREAVDQVARDLEGLAVADASRPGLIEWQVGQRVRIRATDRPARIVEAVGEDRVRVQAGDINLVLKPADLIADADAPEEDRVENTVSLPAGGDVSTRLDLRGWRVEDALLELDAFLDGSLLAGLEYIEILHGKGSGALRDAIGEALSRDRRVSTQRLAEQARGGSGVTLAWLSGGRA